MRNNQITIKITRYNDQVPEGYGKDQQIISVYADSNNVFEALSAAYCETICKLKEHEKIPSFGCVGSLDNLDEKYENFIKR